MKRPRPLTRCGLWLLPMVALVCVCVPMLGQGDFNVDTGHYSAVALQAWRGAVSGRPEWLWSLRGMGGDPAQGGTFYFNKPPLAFWAHGLSLLALGPTVLAARLPSVLAAVLALGFTMGTVRELRGRREAVLTGLVLAWTPEFFRTTHAFSLDLWQLAGVSACVYGVVLAGRRVATGVVVAGVGLGAALMVKPLVALVAVPLLFFWAWSAGWGRRGLMKVIPLVMLVALVVAGPWHLSMWIQHGDAFTGQYIGRQIVDRARGLLDMNSDAASWWYYGRVIGTSWWPWLVTVLLGVVALGRGRLGPRPGLGLAVLWIVAWVVMLSCFADKRPRYLIIVAPMAAWVSAAWLLSCAPRAVAISRRAVVRWCGPVLVVGAVVLCLWPVKVHKEEPAGWTAAHELLRSARPEHVVGAGVSPMGASRVYLRNGFWPRPSVDYAGKLIEPGGPRRVEAGAWMIYEARAGAWSRELGQGERVLLSNDAVTITQAPSEPAD